MSETRTSDPHTLINALSLDHARVVLARCCGSSRWVAGMLARRPFASASALYVHADAVWGALERADFLEAFAHHPQIGTRAQDGQNSDSDSDRDRNGSDNGGGGKRTSAGPDSQAAAWSRQEQARVAAAADDTRRALAAANAEYLRRFGYIFIVCATGKSAEDMLRLLNARLDNDPDGELAIAAAEQARITRLRLEKLGS